MVWYNLHKKWDQKKVKNDAAALDIDKEIDRSHKEVVKMIEQLTKVLQTD